MRRPLSARRAGQLKRRCTVDSTVVWVGEVQAADSEVPKPTSERAWCRCTNQHHPESVMYIGPDRAGNLLETGVVEWHDGLAILHAMPARPKFVR
jgi:hypothetical protein